MAFYSYRCDSCFARDIDDHYVTVGAPHPRRCRCGGLMVRYIDSVGIVRGMTWGFEPHFSNAVGAEVRSPLELSEKLKLAAAKETEATGVYHEYAMVDPRDRGVFGVSDDAVEINKAVNRGVRLQEAKEAIKTGPPGGWGDAPPLEGERT